MKQYIPLLAFFILGVGLLFLSNAFKPHYSEGPNGLVPPTQNKCGIQECHGLNLTCGPNVVEMCTEMYQAGDGCRGFFECGMTDTPDGKTQCAPAPNEKFKLCKACVQKCESDFAGDPEKIFQCDSACSNNTYE